MIWKASGSSGLTTPTASRRAGGRFRARRAAVDHWHRVRGDEGRPYAFRDADTLLADFFREVRRVLGERGLSDEVVRVEETKEEGQ